MTDASDGTRKFPEGRTREDPSTINRSFKTDDAPDDPQSTEKRRHPFLYGMIFGIFTSLSLLALLLEVTGGLKNALGVRRQGDGAVTKRVTSTLNTSSPRKNCILRLGTAHPTGVYYPVGVGIASVLNTEIDSICVEVVPTDGSNQNIRMLDRGELELAIVQSDVLYFSTSTNDVLGYRSTKVMAVASLFDEALHVLVRRDHGIISIQDIADRAIDLGPPESGSRFSSERLLQLMRLEVRSQALAPPEPLAALSAGTISGLMSWEGFPSPSVSMLLQNKNIALLSLPEDAVQALQSHPFYRPYDVDPGTYPGQTERVRTLAVRAVLICRNDLEASLIRRILEVLFSSLPELEKHHPVVKCISADHMDKGLAPSLLHQGARDYELQTRHEK